VGDRLSHAQHSEVTSALLWIEEEDKQARKLYTYLDVVDIRGTLFHGPRSENARNEKGALLFSQLKLGPLQCSLNFNSRTGS